MAVTVTPPGTAAQPLNSPDHATWAGQVYNDLRSLDTAAAAHAAAADPHPQYLTSTEGGAAYETKGAAAAGDTAHAAAADPHPQYVLESQVGNLLTDNQASIETDTTGFFSFQTPTLSSVAASASHGSKVLRVVLPAGFIDLYLVGGAGTNGIYFPVDAGAAYTFVVSARETIGTRYALAQTTYFTSAFAAVGGTINSPVFTPPSSGMAQYRVTTVAPATAAYAQIRFEIAAGTASDVFELDCLGFWRGAGGTWAMPGTPITNLGIQTGTDGVTQAWDTVAGAWVNVENGWETVSTLGALPPTGNWAGRQIRVTGGLGLQVMVWDPVAGSWVVDPVSFTGWNVVPMINGWTVGTLVLRRAGRHVFINLQGIGGPATFINPYVLKTGWIPDVSSPPQIGAIHREALVSGLPVWSLTSATVLFQYGGLVSGAAWSATYGVRGLITFPTSDAWPTSAPT